MSVIHIVDASCVVLDFAGYDGEGASILGLVVVQKMEIQIQGGISDQVNANVRGQLPDAGCSTIASADQVTAYSHQLYPKIE